MLKFKPISLQDKPVVDEYVLAEASQNCAFCFGNMVLWGWPFRCRIAQAEGRLALEYRCHRGTFFAYPPGRGPLHGIIDKMEEYSRSRGRMLELRSVTQAQRAALERECPGRFDFSPDRDSADYLYLTEALATLSGKKYHGKRNHCSRFETRYTWRFEPLTPALFDDCRAVLAAWEAKKGSSVEEKYAITTAFDCWEPLDMEGGVLYADDRAVAFSFGEQLSPNTFDVHFEKAVSDVEGAYPMVCRELARQLRVRHPEIAYINREEDRGIPGLRRAKEEWHPLCLIEKFTATSG